MGDSCFALQLLTDIPYISFKDYSKAQWYSVHLSFMWEAFSWAAFLSVISDKNKFSCNHGTTIIKRCRWPIWKQNKWRPCDSVRGKKQVNRKLVVEKGYFIKATHSYRERYYLQVCYEKGNTRDITLVNVKCELVTSIPTEYVYWRLSQIVKHISCHLKKALQNPSIFIIYIRTFLFRMLNILIFTILKFYFINLNILF